jgi:hypothetical protein
MPLTRTLPPLAMIAHALGICVAVSGCFRVGGPGNGAVPPARPPSLEAYYSHTGLTYSSFKEDVGKITDEFTMRHLVVTTDAGPMTIDFYQGKKPSDDLVFVFPVLGGKLIFEHHIAEYLAGHGIDAAIVHRSNEFKDPKRFNDLEELFRQNIIRDRLAIDFFEHEFAKRDFGTFGISRGGINVALSAGVDARLKYNVMVLGGTDLIDIFRTSDQRRIKRYIDSVCTDRGITEKQFFELLRQQVKTDPKNTAHYIDPRNSLLILAMFDQTVPFRSGLRLRQQLGYPATIFLFANHYTGLLYTQTVSLIPPRMGPGIFPFPYVEQEAVAFFERSFGTGSGWGAVPYRIAQFPMNLVAEALNGIGTLLGSGAASAQVQTAGSEQYWANVLAQTARAQPRFERSDAELAEGEEDDILLELAADHP